MITIPKKYYSNNIKHLIRRISVLHKYLFDPNVSLVKKLIVCGMFIYLFSPIDILPDPILGFGFIDDIFIAIYVISIISNELDKYINSKKNNKYNNNYREIKINKDKIIYNVEYKIEDE